MHPTLVIAAVGNAQSKGLRIPMPVTIPTSVDYKFMLAVNVIKEEKVKKKGH